MTRLTIPPIPHEHGAWAMLYAPYLLAIFASQRFNWAGFTFGIVMTVIFLAYEPLAMFVRLNPARPSSPYEFRRAKIWLGIYLSIILFGGSSLLFIYQRRLFIPFGIVLGIFLMIHIWMAAKRHERSVSGEIIGILSLTFSAPGVSYAMTGEFGRFAIMSWIFSILFFLSSVFYVKMRVLRFARKPQARRMISINACYHLVLIVLIYQITDEFQYSRWHLLGFAPIVIRALLGMLPNKNKLNLKQIGIAESVYTLLFLIFAVKGFNP